MKTSGCKFHPRLLDSPSLFLLRPPPPTPPPKKKKWGDFGCLFELPVAGHWLAKIPVPKPMKRWKGLIWKKRRLPYYPKNPYIRYKNRKFYCQVFELFRFHRKLLPRPSFLSWQVLLLRLLSMNVHVSPNSYLITMNEQYGLRNYSGRYLFFNYLKRGFLISAL